MKNNTTKMQHNVTINEKEILPFVAQSHKLVIETQQQATVASELLSQLNRYSDKLKEDREKITQPLNEALKEIRAKYKPTETSLNDAVAIIKEKLGKYQLNQIKAHQEALKAFQLGSTDLETVVSTVAESKIVTNSGKISFRTVQQLKVMDATLIPRDYLLVNEAKILADLKAGKKVLGCVLEDVQSVINRRN